MTRYRPSNIFFKILKSFFLIFYLIITIFPILWLILTSIKKESLSFAIPPVWFFKPTIENYVSAFTMRPFLNYLMNSLVVTISVTVISIILGTFAAYSISRFKKGGKNLAISLFALRVMPGMAIIIPLFIFFSKLGLVNSKIGLIIAYLTFILPFSILILKNFFDAIPKGLEEAALIDGCSYFGAIFKIILPLSVPAIIATSIFCIIFSWNEFLFAAILTRAQTQTLPVAITGFITDRGLLWGQMTAASVVIVLPVLIFSIIVQKYLVSGLTFGALKE